MNRQRGERRGRALPGPWLLLVAVWVLFGVSCRAPGAGATHTRGVLVLWQEEDQESYQEDDFQEDDFDDDFGEFDEGEGTVEVIAVNDPLSGFNRAMFVFNDKLYVWVLDPVARVWRFLAPQSARVAIGRFFTNATTPVRFLNDLFQLELGKAGLELGRFLVNTTLGIGGLFDPADSWLGWEAPPPEDFGQTLGSYGVGPGFHLVLPFLGPSNLRDALSAFPDAFAQPAYYLSTGTGLAANAGSQLNYVSLHLGEYESLRDDALDPYTFIRNAYEQNRLKQIDE